MKNFLEGLGVFFVVAFSVVFGLFLLIVLSVIYLAFILLEIIISLSIRSPELIFVPLMLIFSLLFYYLIIAR